jgi:REP element-mobilizing transposase RayT
MSYAKIWIHAVWGTKHRLPTLQPPILGQMCQHIRENAKLKGIYIDRINGYHDHVHVLMLLKSEYGISKQMQLLKGESAFWANKTKLINGNFEWADKYFAASVSEKSLRFVRQYIENQQRHHGKQSFEAEFSALAQSAGYDSADSG